MLNEKDRRILELLKRDAKMTTQEISLKTMIPATTVHNRIAKMEKEGVIRNYTVVLDNAKAGKAISAYILVIVDYKFLKEKKLTQHALAETLRKHEFVEEVAMITGVSDIILKMSAPSMSELNEFVTKYLRNVDGIEKTQTSVVLSSF